MQRITGLPEEQVLAYEAQAEAAMRAALEHVMDVIARRIEASMPVLASVLVAADQGDIIPPSDVPAGDGLPPGQPYVSPDDLASIPPLWQTAVEQQILPIVAQVFLDAAGRTYAGMVEASSIAGLPSVGSLAAERYLAQAQNTFEQVGDDLWATARTELSDGFERGESIPQLAERLRASAGVTARTGVLVARTQVNEASNAGSFATAQASGLKMQKEWIATPDLRTRPEHLAADGQRVDLADPFIVGGYSAIYPAAPSLPPSMRFNCRCTIGYVMSDRAPARVRQDDLQTQELADLPGTTTIDDLAAAQHARLQQIIDEQHAAVEQVVQDVHQQFRDRFGKGVGPGVGDLGPDAVVDPRAIRLAYRQAKTSDELRAAWQDEMRRITSRDIIVQMPPGASVLTMRQYAEGVTQMLERFPEARLRKVSWWSDGTTGDYARIARGSATIEFNAYWAADVHRAEYLRALRHDVSGWTGPERSGWSVRGASTPQATAYHEFAHILDIETLSDGAKFRALDIATRRAVVRGVGRDELIASDVSAYATSNGNELIAEAMTDVMVNGQRASAASREIYDLIVADYKARGLAVRTTTHVADELFPKAAAGGGLNAKTVAQLRALAKERGIVIPTGARKADLVKALSEPTPAGPAMPSLEVRTSLTAAEQTRVRTLVRRDPQIVATVQDRHGPISWSGNLSDADAAWLEQIYKRDRAFVERVAQEADIRRTIAAEAKKLGITPMQYRAREAERLKTLLDEKPIAVRVRDEAGLQDILSNGRFKTSLEGARRAQGLVVAKDRRQLGESIMGVSPDIPLTERPVYGYVAVRGVEPALSAGRKIEWLAQREGQEDILSAYGQIQVVLKPEVRARTTVTVGDSLDEVGFVRPSPIDNPAAESIGTARRLEAAITEPDWTRSRYVEAQIHGGLRREDIAEIVFPDQPGAATVTALQQSGIPWRVLRKGDAPIFPTQAVAPVLDEKALLRAAARERNRLIESSQGTAKLLAEVDELIANKATKAAIRQRLDPALIAPEQVYAGADPAIVDALRTALDTGDPAKLRSALTRAGTKAKLKPVSKAGAKATFDAETMEGVGGTEIAPGAQVSVVRRGTTLTLPDGSTMQLTRAQVTPIVPKAPVKRGITEVKLPPGQRGQDVFPVQWMIDSPTELSAAPRAITAAERDRFAQAIRQWVRDKPKGDVVSMAQPYVNAALRGTAEMTPARQATVEALDDALAASRSTRSVTLYRGFTSGEHILPDDWQTADLTGLRWEEKGFTAASDQLDFAETYAGEAATKGFAIRFTLPKGSHGVSIRDITGGLDDEGEVLLPRGMEFHVIADRGIQGDYGVRWLDVEVRPKKVPIKATKRAPETVSTETTFRDIDGRHASAWGRELFTAPAELSPAELQAAKNYAGGAYQSTNRYLRTGQVGPSNRGPVLDDIRGLDSLLQHETVPEDIIVSRAGSVAHAFGGRDPSSMVGEVISDPGYLSTTVGGRVSGVAAKRKTNDVVMQIEVPAGTHGYYMGRGIADFAEERELLLPRDTMLQIISAKKVGFRWHVVARVVPKAVKAPTRAVVRQAAIDEARQVGDLAAEVLELSNNGASVAALRSRITATAKRLGTPDEVRDALLEVTSRTGDVLRAQALQQLERAGITPIGTAGQVVKFDRKIHDPIPGVKAGDLVVVDRPGLTFTRDGEKIQLAKAKVGPAPKAPPSRPAGQTMVDREIALRRIAKAPVKGEPRFLGAGTQGDVKLYTTSQGEYVEKQLASYIRTKDLKAVRDAEELGPLVLDAFGLEGPTTYSTGARGLISEFVEGKTGAELFPGHGFAANPEGRAARAAQEHAIREIVDSDDGRLMGLADYVMGNSDRNSGNWLRQTGGRLAGIDHGYSFQMGSFRDVTITPQGDFGEWLQTVDRVHLTATVDVDPRDLAIIRARLEELRPRFTEASRSAWFNTMMRRLAELEKRAVGTTPRIAT